MTLIFRNRSASSGQSRGAGRVAGTVIACLFILLGVAILFPMVRSVQKAQDARTWLPTPCQIIRSGYILPGVRSDAGYRFDVEYRYEQGGSHTSTQYRLDYSGSADFEPIQRLMLKFPPESPATCYVNSRNPAESILELPTLAGRLVLLVPISFSAVGIILLLTIWFFPKSSRKPAHSPLSSAPASRAPRLAASFLFGVFFLAGSLITYFVTGPSLSQSFASSSWQKVPATVVFGRVVASRDSDGTTYRADVLYQYEIKAKTYLSNRRDHVGGSSSGSSAKQQFVSKHPPGSQIDAYVNPSDPVVAVLEPGFTVLSLLLCIPVLFALIGAIGILSQLRSRKTSTEPAPGMNMPNRVPIHPPHAASPAQFNSAKSRRSKFIILVIFSLFWNAIVWGISYSILSEGSIKSNICPMIFMSIFVLIGLGVIGAAIHSLLALFNPTVQIEFSKSPLQLGDSLVLKWNVNGRFDRISQFTITLEGHEIARYRRGTDTHTDKHLFLKQPIVETAKQIEIAKGQKPLNIPADTMHSFKSSDNEIKWTLVIHGEISGWPDVKDELDLQIFPLPAERINAEVSQ